MYRLIVESLLGLRLEVDKLHFAPCLPADWQECKVHYRYRETVYHITVLQTVAENAGMTVTVDGMERDDQAIPLVDDRQEHRAEVRIHVAPSQRTDIAYGEKTRTPCNCVTLG
jgi:cellobiose phosphorylase